MSESTFSVQQVVRFIQSRDWDGCINFSAADIMKNNVKAITQVYTYFLLDCDFSLELLQTDVVQFSQLEDLQNLEMQKGLILQLNLYFALEWTIKALGVGDLQFGLMDLLDPKPERTLHFFSQLQNFWILCNHNIEDANKVEADMEHLCTMENSLMNQIREFREQQDRRGKKEFQDKAEIKELDEKLEEMNGHMNEIAAAVKEIQTEVEALQVDKYQEECHKKFSRLTELNNNIESDDRLQALNSEISEKEEEGKMLTMRMFQFKKGMEETEELVKEYEEILSKEHINKDEYARSKINKTKDQEKTAATKEIVEKEELVDKNTRDKELTINTIKDNFNAIKLKWSRRKEGKDYDLRHIKAEMESLSQTCGQWKLDMITSKREVDNQLQEIHREIQAGEKKVQQDYRRILEDVEKFNDYMNNECAKIQRISSKLY